MNCRNIKLPQIVEALLGKEVVAVVVASPVDATPASSVAALTSENEVYVWGGGGKGDATCAPRKVGPLLHFLPPPPHPSFIERDLTALPRRETTSFCRSSTRSYGHIPRHWWSTETKLLPKQHH